MRELYTNLTQNRPLEDIKLLEDFRTWIINATRLRQFDIQDFDKQTAENPRIFDAPSSSTDTVGTEKVNDVAADSSFLYVIIDNAGTLEWRRVAISSF